MNRRIVYLINPISGTGKKDELLRLINKKTSERKIDFEIFPTVGSGDYSFLEHKIKEEGITDIAVCGGDGSVNQVVDALAHTDLNFGIIPMGSGNGLALTAGIPRNRSKAIDVLFEGTPQLVDAFRVNKQFACMLCGLGFDAGVAHQFAKQPNRGLRTYVSLVIKGFFSAKPYPFSVQANNYSFEVEAFFISVANSNQFGNNFTIAPKAKLSDGLLDVVIVKKIPKPLLLLTVMRQVLTGQSKKIENTLRSPVIYFQTPEVVLKNYGEAPMHIDGEPRETIRDLTIKILPKHFKLIHGL